MRNLSLRNVDGSTLMLLSLGARGLLMALASVAIARLLGVYEFGIYAIVISTQGVVTLFADFGIGWSLTKFISEHRAKNSDEALGYAKSGFILAGIFTGFSCACYILLSHSIGVDLFHEHSIVRLVPISCLAVVGSVLLSNVSGVVLGLQRLRLLAAMQVASSCLVVIMVLLLVPRFGIEGALFSFVIGQGGVALASALAVNSTGFDFLWASSHRNIADFNRRLLSFAAPAVLSSLFLVLVLWIGNAELKIVSGFESVGFFAVAMIFYQALAVISQSISIPLFPRVSAISAVVPQDIKKTTHRSLRSMVSFFPIFFGAGLFSFVIIDLFYGAAYSDSSRATYPLIVAAYLLGMTSILNSTLGGIGKVWVILRINILWAAAFMILVFAFVPSWGAMGFAVAYMCSNIVQVVATTQICHNLSCVNKNELLSTLILPTFLFALGYMSLLYGSGFMHVEKVALLVLGSLIVIAHQRREPRLRSSIDS